jgi:hypothetical protein
VCVGERPAELGVEHFLAAAAASSCACWSRRRALVGGPQAQTLLEHGTAYYAVVSLIWSAAIIVVFGLLAAVRFSRR